MPMRENIYDATIHRPMLRIPPSNQKGVLPAIRYPSLPLSVDLLAKDPRVCLQWYNTFLEKWVKDLKYIQRI